MLKALELFGFKSFADKTRLEFPSGICVVVGPNGSGKSNIVDAVKWVLGSQSAKSLRGKEMIDVIFNGCASRPPSGTGEVTLTLDNEEGRLAIEAREVHVTRRVYRSGEGEYLLNREPCRLRDIRELLASTGITTEAYCIIEQGKVDALLQSSPRERRVVFEEAAGISQFKLKKAAAARRMERVEQNLLRLSDIVDEVESRLRSLRLQAGKARRYREFTERLRQLRMEVALVDWRALTRQLAGRESQLAEFRQRIEECSAQLARDEAAGQDLERRIEASAQEVRELEAQGSATREQIAARQATLENQHARRLELDEEVALIREQLEGINTNTHSADERVREAAELVLAAEAELLATQEACSQQVARADDSRRELAAAQAALQTIQVQVAECTRTRALLANEMATHQAELPRTSAKLDEARVALSGFRTQRDALTKEMASFEKIEADEAAQVDKHREQLSAAERQLSEVRRELSRADLHHRRTEGHLTRVRERIAVLSELESRLEGLGSGVQDVLRLVQSVTSEVAGDVRGLVADVFHVDVDTATLIEVALGERTQFIVLSSAGRLLEWLKSNPLRVADRVGFLSLNSRHALTALDHVDLAGEAGVMGRADRFVEAATEYQPLVRRLLGRTWLVDRLTTAQRLSETTGRGLEFVTSDGEYLAADGTLIVGPRHAAAGMLSRRSELRSCHEQARELEHQLTEQAAVHTRLERERAELEAQVTASVAAYTASASQLSETRRQTAACGAKLDRLTHECRRLEEEVRIAVERITAIQSQIEANGQEISKTETAADQLNAELQAAKAEMVALQKRHETEDAAALERKMALARCEQRAEMLRAQMELAQRSQQERDQLLANTRQQLVDREAQIVELGESIRVGRQNLDELASVRNRQSEQFALHAAADEALRRERAGIIEQIRSRREQVATLQTQQHKCEVASTRIRHERQTLCERMQEDYGIDLAEAESEGKAGASASGLDSPVADALGSPPSDVAFDREAADREISQLRDQINNIGAINLEALDELEQIEARFEKISGQYRDLVEAKESLERIIQRINADSRQLFLTTLETIRGHFQELFRRLFGGGEADIMVDEAEDVLECGIEIVARPPGKEACSISLLSGGEKTLTCVALLLAVFRSKPSPFCILDEVDAALDEANIGRFVAVLRDFLSFTQFIVITHSKKTMAGADTLYGVTMEESGVSKRVSVRFEDVSEDGHISPAAMRASNAAGLQRPLAA